MIKTYFNSKAAIWDDEVAEKDAIKLSQMAERLLIRKGAKVLDVGTGTGVFIPYLQKHMGERGLLIAMDIAEKMLHVKGGDPLLEHLLDLVLIAGISMDDIPFL